MFFSHAGLLWFLGRSWAKSARSWSWSWCPACWTERWTATCCRARRGHLWILRSRWSLAWRRGPSTTGYRFPSGTAKPPVKTSSGKLSPPANSALWRPPPHQPASRPGPRLTAPHSLFCPPGSTWTVVELSCTWSSQRVRHVASMDFTDTARPFEQTVDVSVCVYPRCIYDTFNLRSTIKHGYNSLDVNSTESFAIILWILKHVVFYTFVLKISNFNLPKICCCCCSPWS